MQNFLTAVSQWVRRHPRFAFGACVIGVGGVFPELFQQLLMVLAGIAERAFETMLVVLIDFLTRNADTIGSLILIVVLVVILWNMITAPFRKKSKRR